MKTNPAAALGSQITVNGVSKIYASRRGPVEALREIHLEAGRGEFISLLGPSGCGKSTLLMILAGLTRVSAGSVLIDDVEVRGPQTQVGIAFQDPVLLDWRSAIENVMLQIEARRLPAATYRVKARELLRKVGLDGFEDAAPYELSGGMKQRVAICRALIHDPPLLLMDEPFGALDALTRDQMAVDLQSMWLESGKTVVFVTHSIAEAVFLSDRIIVMTPRPGQLDAVIPIGMRRPRRLHDRATPEFTEPVAEITRLFEARGVLREGGAGA
jgi:NitT/TauT family transport system ATP-binding protein